MTVYFRSPDVVITERTIRVRVPGGWQVWVIRSMTDFGIVRTGPSTDQWNWGMGFSALVVVVLAIQLRGWALLLPFAVLVLVAGWCVLAGWRTRRQATAQLWAWVHGAPVLVYELPERDFDAAARALRRVLDRIEDEATR